MIKKLYLVGLMNEAILILSQHRDPPRSTLTAGVSLPRTDHNFSVHYNVGKETSAQSVVCVCESASEKVSLAIFLSGLSFQFGFK